MVTVRTVVREVGFSDWARDKIRVKMGLPTIDNWIWSPKEEKVEKKPAKTAGKIPHIWDNAYAPTTGKKKRPTPNIHSVPNIPVYDPVIALATSARPVDVPTKPTRKVVKEVAKKNVEEPTQDDSIEIEMV
jgi:hypothetical protein